MANKPLKTLNFGGEDTYYLNPSWENITDRPFGETTTYGDTLTWDGNTEGLVCVAGMFYFVSDVVPTIEDFSDGSNVTWSDFGEEKMPTTVSENNGVILGMYGDIPTFTVVPSDNYEMDGNTLPSAGVYLYADSTMHTSSLQINGYTGFPTTETVPLPNKYLDIIETVGGDTLTWDGNTEGLEIEAGAPTYYHVSEIVPSTDDLANGFSLGVSVDEESYKIEFSSENVNERDGVLLCGSDIETFFIVQADNTNIEGLVFNKKGVYFLNTDGLFFSSLTINGYTGFTKEQVKQEYIKDVILAVLEEKGLLS